MKKITNSRELIAEFYENGIDVSINEMFYFGNSDFTISLNNLKKVIEHMEKELKKYKKIYKRCEKNNYSLDKNGNVIKNKE